MNCYLLSGKDDELKLSQQTERAVHKQRTRFMWDYGLIAVDLVVFALAAFWRK